MIPNSILYPDATKPAQINESEKKYFPARSTGGHECVAVASPHLHFFQGRSDDGEKYTDSKHVCAHTFTRLYYPVTVALGYCEIKENKSLMVDNGCRFFAPQTLSSRTYT